MTPLIAARIRFAVAGAKCQFSRRRDPSRQFFSRAFPPPGGEFLSSIPPSRLKFLTSIPPPRVIAPVRRASCTALAAVPGGIDGVPRGDDGRDQGGAPAVAGRGG